MAGGGDIPVPTPVVGARARSTSPTRTARWRRSTRSEPTRDRRHHARQTARPSNAHIAWSYRATARYMQTPLVYGDLLYVCRDNGVLSVFDARTGERKYQAAARRRHDGLHRVAGRRRRQDLLHQRRGRRLRREGRADVRAARDERAGRGRAWRRRRSRRACSTSARAATWWRSASVRRLITASAAAIVTTAASSASSSGFAFDSIQIATAAAPRGMAAGTENAPAG